MSEGESSRKHIGQLIINQNRFTFIEHELETTRVVVWSSMSLTDICTTETDIHGNPRLPKNYVAQTEEGLDAEIERLLRIAENERQKNYPRAPVLPLVRVRLVHCFEKFKDFNVNVYNRKWENKIGIRDFKQINHMIQSKFRVIPWNSKHGYYSHQGTIGEESNKKDHLTA